MNRKERRAQQQAGKRQSGKNKNRSKGLQKWVDPIGFIVQYVIIILLLYSAKVGLSNTSPLKLLERWRRCIILMTGNPYFATPDPTLADQTLMCDELEAAILDADSGDHDKIAHRNDVFDDAKDMFRLMVWYVTTTAKGNREIIRSAGLVEKMGRGPSHVPGRVLGLQAEYFGIGKVRLFWKRVSTDVLYRIYITTDPVNGTWVEVKPGTFRLKYIVYDLTSGVEYYFRMSAENSLGMGDVSEVCNFRCG
ncbi:MAG: fibronectin type III domain-containing protein [Bacteroidetes bacterium]|nr:fibronectin type III domain-containing protein [Bacteroidota bacterium]